MALRGPSWVCAPQDLQAGEGILAGLDAEGPGRKDVGRGGWSRAGPRASDPCGDTSATWRDAAPGLSHTVSHSGTGAGHALNQGERPPASSAGSCSEAWTDSV
jgi:hypothetical protein